MLKSLAILLIAVGLLCPLASTESLIELHSSRTVYNAAVPLAVAPPGGVLGGTYTIQGGDSTESLIDEEDVMEIVEAGRQYGENLGLIWSNWKNPDRDYYLGGYDMTISTEFLDRDQVVEAICEYIDDYIGYGYVKYFYIQLLPDDNGHYLIHVYRG